MYCVKFPLFLINDIIFIIRVLKLLFMHGKYILLALVAILFFTSPVLGSLTKITSGSPVFIGESNLDISSALLDCHTIAWWANGSDTATPPAKNLTISIAGQDSTQVFHYTISPDVFTGYTGNWYCEDKKPLRVVFEVREPQLEIRAWDLDTGEDVTGKTVPSSSNITYRIDTNLYSALQFRNRPNINPLDSFFKVNLTDPQGKGISNVYSGSYGAASTQIVAFDSSPYISSSPYFWKNANVWNRESRNANGEKIYPDGTYTFMVVQNLNHVQETYAASSIKDVAGKTSASARVTFLHTTGATSLPTTTPPVMTTLPVESTPVVTGPVSPEPTTVPGPQKTTYASFPLWIVPIAFVIAGLIMGKKRV